MNELEQVTLLHWYMTSLSNIFVYQVLSIILKILGSNIKKKKYKLPKKNYHHCRIWSHWHISMHFIVCANRRRLYKKSGLTVLNIKQNWCKEKKMIILFSMCNYLWFSWIFWSDMNESRSQYPVKKSWYASFSGNFVVP